MPLTLQLPNVGDKTPLAVKGCSLSGPCHNFLQSVPFIAYVSRSCSQGRELRKCQVMGTRSCFVEPHPEVETDARDILLSVEGASCLRFGNVLSLTVTA